MIESKRKRDYPYPTLTLPPGTIRATLVNQSESATTTPTQVPNKDACPAPKMSKSVYEFSISPVVRLMNRQGKMTRSSISGMTCVGYNQKGKSIIKALGANIVGAVQL
ncbi:MAG: hypothetical protein EOP05_11630 [Proteobacteria bacterium]|nr:MAG: hypothetical protein EOP05_11630 [Pseudomonadota bacterium]